ncbi:hypothetical protein BUE93_21005 [Chromobacterium amazonense]|uniref:Uncharacterized protein n=1 Tax=Chromobacterium amazonense TaxID=1382803 RepID=A0A2S9WYZ0_9NEIS|nr:hypothetical protein BUE93_21005 [Chromobacterium amazonense]
MAKEGVIARQFLLGVVQTADGTPLYQAHWERSCDLRQSVLPTRYKSQHRERPSIVSCLTISIWQGTDHGTVVVQDRR